jgi:3-keto-disaccharide hydrolase
MNRRDFVISTVAGAMGLATVRLAGQSKSLEHDLAALADGKKLNVFNRSASSFVDGTRKGVRLSENPGDGVAFLQGVQFANGTIELDLKGKDVQQQSFLGMAFHGVDATTYDGIYFRPFNFKTDDQARRIRAVQYISHPGYPWDKLRADKPGQYEKAVNPVPDPNGWFHARVVVASPNVSVFVNDGTTPCLVVNQLSNRGKGLVGLWVGNTSGGDFANLKITG